MRIATSKEQAELMICELEEQKRHVSAVEVVQALESEIRRLRIEWQIP